MCQLLGVSSDGSAWLALRWDAFMARGSVPGGNSDGWGVALLRDHDVTLIREPEPAASSEAVRFLQSSRPPSPLILSHVRRATRGAISLANTQPFVRRVWGRAHVFAHNGFVGDLEMPSEPWAQPIGQTDSEQIFGVLLSRLANVWRAASPPLLADRAAVVAQLASELRDRGAANFLYADGSTLFAHAHRRTVPGDALSREPGLYLLERALASGDDMARPCDGVRASGDCTHQCIVATVPLDDQPWNAMPSGELVCIEAGRRVA